MTSEEPSEAKQHRVPAALEALAVTHWQSAPSTLIDQLARHLSTFGQAAMREIGEDQLAEAWLQVIERILDPTHGRHQIIADELGMHPTTLQRSLEVAMDLMEELPSRRSVSEIAASHERTLPAYVALAGNTPVLLLQVLLPALVERRPVLFKLPSTAPTFGLTVLDTLFDLLPSLRNAVAALTWSSTASAGSVEAAVCSAQPGFAPLLVYGDDSTVSHYRERLSLTGKNPASLIAFGNKTSFALIQDQTSAQPTWLKGIARDIALFEQQGCLSVTAVALVADPETAEQRAHQLAEALRTIAHELPPPQTATDPLSSAAARHWFDAALIAGATCFGDVATNNAVVVSQVLVPAPAERCVNLVAFASLEHAVEALKAADDSIQGVAIWAPDPTQTEQIRRLLQQNSEGLRVTEAGELQRTESSWRNDGVDLFEAFATPA